MSFVGPRPEVPKYVELFRDDYAAILEARPGITDFASLRYRDEAAVIGDGPDAEDSYIKQILPDKLRLAREYVCIGDLRVDIALILRTAASMFVRQAPLKHAHGNAASVLLVGNFLHATAGTYGVCEEFAGSFGTAAGRC